MREAAIEQPLGAAAAAVAARLDALAEQAQGRADAPGRACRRRSCCSAVSHCATKAPTPRWWCRSAPRPRSRAAFEAAYQRRFAFLMQRARADRRGGLGRGDRPPANRRRSRGSRSPRAPAPPCRRARADVQRWPLARRRAGAARATCARATAIAGPAMIAEQNATTVVEPGWQARVTARDHLLLERVQPRDGAARDRHRRSIRSCSRCSTTCSWTSPSRWALQLQNTAYSVNIKERLDFSCALFDADGNLIANAPHMPVHLGSMSESIKTVIARNAGTMRPGDVYVLNDPYHGGTHLPDVTVVTPVSHGLRRDGRWTAEARAASTSASRGHHADIGGITPGSMPPFSTRIDEEGVRSTTSSWSTTAGFCEAEMLRAARRSGPLPVAQPGAEPRRPEGADRRQREGRRRSCTGWSSSSGCDGGAGLHAARAGQRRGVGAPRDRRGCTTARSRCRSTTARRSRSRSASTPSRAQRDDRLHRQLGAARRTTSTRRRRCAWPRCSTSSARWSTTTSR